MIISLTIPEFSRYSVTETGEVYQKRGKTFKRVNSFFDRDGYERVMIYNNKKQRKTMAVHRAVFSAFTKELAPGLCIDHLDGNRKNNFIDNLEQVTFEENIRRGAAARPKPSPNRKLSPEQVLDVFTKREKGFSYQKIADDYGMHWSSIYEIIKGNHYKEAAP
jgi:hypothetical protein